ncbi:MAG TPA: type II toxin-antitoxin system prevent-host-death family antitoxin [Dehalococcoidia bacterium]|nr:type II toxin-antitoxin system prevent-host-death family antitoxin [Dehalococcoidia bacterium]
MKQISIRELRQQASAWLREVQSGQSFEVTDRGRPVALLSPLPGGGELDRLVASGQVRPPKEDLLDLGPPLSAIEGVPLPSQVLEDMRAAER